MTLERTPTTGGSVIATWGVDEARHVLQTLFNTAHDGIVVADAEARCLDANPSACRLLAKPLTELLGVCIAEHMDAPAPSRADLLDETKPTGSFRVRRDGGAPNHVAYRVLRNILPSVTVWMLRDITDHVATRDELVATEHRLRTVIANAPLIVFAVDRDGIYTLHEGKAVEALGAKPGELVGQSMMQRLRTAPAPADTLSLLAQALAGTVSRGEYALGDKTFECVLTPDRDAAGNVIGATGVALDVTERKQAETRLRASEMRFREMIERSHDGISLLDANLRTLYQSPAVARMFGYSTDEARAIGWTDFIIPADAARLQPIAAKLLATPGSTVQTELTLRHRNGSLRIVDLTATNLLNEPAIQAIVTNFRDITERRAYIEALHTSEQRYRRIVEGTSDGVVQTDARGTCTYANARAAELLGMPHDELHGTAFLAKFEGNVDGEHAIVGADGTQRWIVIRSAPMRDSAGALDGMLSLVTDITDVKKANEARQYLASIVEHSDEAIISVDSGRRITTWNRAAEKLFGYTAADVLGQPYAILVPSVAPEGESWIDAILAGNHVERQETVRLRNDGTLISVSISASPIRDSHGAIIGVSKIARDLTARNKAQAALRRTEVQLQQAQKLESIAALAGGIAHDFNNLLTVIISCAGLVLEDLREGDPLLPQIVDIQDAGKRASVLTRQLLAFGRKQVLEPRLLDLHKVLLGIERVISRTLREDIELSLVNREPLRLVLADPSQIEQVILNLVVNARDAMPSGGKLIIETSNAQLDEGNLLDEVEVTPGAYTQLSVTDTGAGMDAKTKMRIFEPFFSTKARTDGSGLGLSTVFGIVRQSGGYIYVDSEVGTGSTFRIYFPVAAHAHEAEARPIAHPVPTTRGTETILVAEDDDSVRRMVVLILRRNGYHVLEASNGGEAVTVSEQYEGPIQLLLTDVVMPNMGGRELAERIGPTRPDMRILFMSGYTAGAIAERGVLEPGLEFLQKPITPASLSRKVRDVLDGVAS